MKRIYIFFSLTVLLSAFFFSCSDEPVKQEITSTEWIIPEQIDRDNESPDNSFNIEDTQSTRSLSSISRVSTPLGFQLISVENINLDSDLIEEQLLVLRQDTTNVLFLGIVDYDDIAEDYILSWSNKISADSIVTLTIDQIDILGDHVDELICFGLTDEGLNTLDIFKKSISSQGLALYYLPIFNAEIDGTIEIIQNERSTSYLNNQVNGINFPIVSKVHPEDSENILDVEQTTYRWQFSEGKYIQTNQELIKGTAISSQQLRDLFRGNSDTMLNFLSKAWYRTSNQTPGMKIEICYVDAEDKTVTFYHDSDNDIQDIYSIISYRKRSNYLEMTLKNKHVPSMRYNIVFSVLNLDSININIYNMDALNGSYRRLDMSYLEQENTTEIQAITDIDLTGLYKASSENQINFSFPSFFRYSDQGDTQGQFSFYRLQGQNILELQYISLHGILKETEYYNVSYTESLSTSRIIRTLTLTKGKMTIFGFESDPRSLPLVYEQIEVLEENSQ